MPGSPKQLDTANWSTSLRTSHIDLSFYPIAMTASGNEPDTQVVRFCRQYLQLDLALDFPDDGLLCDAETQEYLYSKLFAEDATVLPPPARYRLRVLKELLARIEAAIVNWDEHVSVLVGPCHLLCEPPSDTVL